MFKLNRALDGTFLSKHNIMLRIVVILFALAGILAVLANITNYIARNNITVQKPLVIMVDSFTRPIVVIEPRKELEVLSPIAKDILESPEIKVSELNDKEKLILEIFGVENYKVARAVAMHEGLNHDADDFNTNTNGTIDVGYFRINSVHFDKKGCSLAEVIKPRENVLCAKQIFDEQGWSPWVAFQNGSFRASL